MACYRNRFTYFLLSKCFVSRSNIEIHTCDGKHIDVCNMWEVPIEGSHKCYVDRNRTNIMYNYYVQRL
jgi:hypothetical protein